MSNKTNGRRIVNGAMGLAAFFGASALTVEDAEACTITLYPVAGQTFHVGTSGPYRRYYYTQHIANIGEKIVQTDTIVNGIPELAAFRQIKVRDAAHIVNICREKARVLAKHSTAGRGTYEITPCRVGHTFTRAMADQICNKRRNIDMPAHRVDYGATSALRR